MASHVIGYNLARDRDQHLACGLFGYGKVSNEAAFTVAVVEKVYAHESLTFDNKITCKVISKWKAGLKDDMDGRSDVYVLSDSCRKYDMVFSCGCKAEIWATKGLLDKVNGNVLGMEIVRDQSAEIWATKGLLDKANGNVLGMEIVRDQSGNTLRVSRSRDCDVEKNSKWSCIYVVGSQKYQMVCTRLDITSVDVGMLDKFDRGLQTNVQVFVNLDYDMGKSINVMESKYELRLVAGITISALVKGGSLSEVPAQVEVVAYCVLGLVFINGVVLRINTYSLVDNIVWMVEVVVGWLRWTWVVEVVMG
nr:zinc finger, CCHC-type [Tanacetum cinerariifolium]